MNLKECFQYANYLNKIYYDAKTCLGNTAYTTTKKEIHKRGKALGDSSIADDIVETVRDGFPDVTPMQMVNFVEDIVKEMENLQDAIEDAKDGSGFDKMVNINSKKREAIAAYEIMLAIKPSTAITQGTDFKFNVEGNQSPYKYEIEVQKSIDFDRNAIRGLVRKLRKEVDNISAKIDELQLMKVDFIPKYCMGDSIFDILEEN